MARPEVLEGLRQEGIERLGGEGEFRRGWIFALFQPGCPEAEGTSVDLARGLSIHCVLEEVEVYVPITCTREG